MPMSMVFTFHYFQICTVVCQSNEFHLAYLHSTIFRFVREAVGIVEKAEYYLHSTIFRFVLFCCSGILAWVCYLHSTIFRFVHGDFSDLNNYDLIYIPLFLDLYEFKRLLVNVYLLQFTFHYFQICTNLNTKHNIVRILFTFHYFQICTEYVQCNILSLLIYIPLFLDLYCDTECQCYVNSVFTFHYFQICTF